MVQRKTEDKWISFYTDFSQNNRQFLNALSETHKSLTLTQFKVCSYIRAGYSTKDIASHLDISLHSADSHVFRLRKKFKLEHTQSLVTYINTIG